MEPDDRKDKKREELKHWVDEILKVYTIPVVPKRVLEVVENERSSISDLVEVIQHDQALSSKIIATANTAFYGFRRNIASIPGAAVTLGFNMVRSLAVSVSVFKCASGDAEFLKNLWQHSFKCALASSLVAERTGIAKKEEAFLAGLIHDLGRAILYQIYGERYLKVSSEGAPEGLSEREVKAFGANHSQVGTWFIDKYRFPRECVLAVEYHHGPHEYEGNRSARNLASVVRIADFIVTGKKEKGDEEAYSKELTEIMESIYLDEEGIKEVREKLSEMEEMIREFYAS